MSKTIRLGVVAKDKVTGFQGVVFGKSSWLTGCDQWCLKSQELKDGKPIEGQWFDVKQVEYVGEGIDPDEVSEAADSGGPQVDAPSA